MSTYNEVIKETMNILSSIKNENISHITSGLYFDEIYLEARKRLGDYLITLPNDMKELIQINSESFFLVFCNTTALISLEVSIENLVDNNNFLRHAQVFDEINHNIIDFKISDYSLIDLKKQNRFSRHTYRALKKAVKDCYELRSSDEFEFNSRFFSTKDDLYKTDFFIEEYNLSLDPYKHNPNDEIDDEDMLASSFDEIDEDSDEDSDLNIRWQTASNNIYQEVSQMMVKDFIEKYKIEISLGLLFEEMYGDFIIKFREIEEKYHPKDKASRDKPLDVFLYFCDYVYGIDVCATRYNEICGYQKKICANKGNVVAIDNAFFKDKDSKVINYDKYTLSEVIDNIHITNMCNLEEMFMDIRDIYLKRKEI